MSCLEVQVFDLAGRGCGPGFHAALDDSVGFRLVATPNPKTLPKKPKTQNTQNPKTPKTLNLWTATPEPDSVCPKTGFSVSERKPKTLDSKAPKLK